MAEAEEDGMSPVKPCDAEITIGWATYRCGRPQGHTQNALCEQPDMHQAIGLEHPADGETYLMTWTSPRRLVGAEAANR